MVKAFAVDSSTERQKLQPSYGTVFFSPPNVGQPKGRVKVSLNLVFPFADFSIKQDKIETAPGTSRATTERKHITQKKSGWHECSLHSRLTSGFVWEFPQVLQVFTNLLREKILCRYYKPQSGDAALPDNPSPPRRLLHYIYYCHY